MKKIIFIIIMLVLIGCSKTETPCINSPVEIETFIEKITYIEKNCTPEIKTNKEVYDSNDDKDKRIIELIQDVQYYERVLVECYKMNETFVETNETIELNLCEGNLTDTIYEYEDIIDELEDNLTDYINLYDDIVIYYDECLDDLDST